MNLEHFFKKEKKGYREHRKSTGHLFLNLTFTSHIDICTEHAVESVLLHRVVLGNAMFCSHTFGAKTCN